MTAEVLQGTLVLVDRTVERGQVVVEGGRIAAVVAGGEHYRTTRDYGDAYILPGLIDVHVHGIAGAGVMDGRPESIERMARQFVTHGVTGFLPSTVTASLDDTRRAIDSVLQYVDGEPGGGAQVLGIHLEGPFISPEFKGMQNEAYILAPDTQVARALLDAGRGRVVRVSLAPEMPGADGVIALSCAMPVSPSPSRTPAPPTSRQSPRSAWAPDM